MNEHVVTRQSIVTEAELKQQGFTPEQIQRFVVLREYYPLIEFVTSRVARDRLVFLRWYYRAGRIVS